MIFEVEMKDYNEINVDDKREIDNLLYSTLGEWKGKQQELDNLTLDCMVSLNNNQSMIGELKEQKYFKRAFNELIGKNSRLRALIQENTENIQYAQQRTLQYLVEQNTEIMGNIGKMNAKNNKLFLDIYDEIDQTNEYVKKVITFLLKYKEDWEKTSNRQRNIEEELQDAAFYCTKCKKIIKGDMAVCPYCGNIRKNRRDDIKELANRAKYELEIDHLSKRIEEAKERWSKMENIYIDKEIEPYVRKLNFLEIYAECILSNKVLARYIKDSARNFRKTVENQKFEIAIIGTVKAGKSTLINALLGSDFASVDVTPETSVLTKFRTTEKENYIKIKYYTEGQWKELRNSIQKGSLFEKEYKKTKAEEEKNKWLNRKMIVERGQEISELKKTLHKFTNSKSPAHFFVREVEIGIKSNLFPNDIYLVDTPGLDDVVAYRSDITRKYMHKADAVLACVKSKSLNENSEVEFIHKVMANRSDKRGIFVVATQKDEYRPSGWEKMRNHFSDILVQMYGEKNKRLVATHFVGVSAQLYNLTRLFLEAGEEAMGEEEFDDLMSMGMRWKYRNAQDFVEKEEEILRISGIPVLKKMLEMQIFVHTREIAHNKLKSQFEFELKGILEQLQAEKAEQNKRYDMTNGKWEEVEKEKRAMREELENIQDAKNDLKQMRKRSKKQFSGC